MGSFPDLYDKHVEFGVIVSTCVPASRTTGVDYRSCSAFPLEMRLAPLHYTGRKREEIQRLLALARQTPTREGFFLSCHFFIMPLFFTLKIQRMCLIAFAHKIVPGYELILIANRDEFLDRPSLPLGWWPDNSNILAGKDLDGGGTWLGVNRNGEWTAITNYREPLPDLVDPPSRGMLTRKLLENNLTLLSGDVSQSFAADDYHGFNLLSGNQSKVGYFSNRSDQEPLILAPGFYGLSNHLLDTPWPKVLKTKEALRRVVGQGRTDFPALFEILANTEEARLDELPDTGISKDWEKLLSPAYINAEELGYGTRMQTILTISDAGQVQMCEWIRGKEEPGSIFSFQRS